MLEMDTPEGQNAMMLNNMLYDENKRGGDRKVYEVKYTDAKMPHPGDYYTLGVYAHSAEEARYIAWNQEHSMPIATVRQWSFTPVKPFQLKDFTTKQNQLAKRNISNNRKGHWQ